MIIHKNGDSHSKLYAFSLCILNLKLMRLFYIFCIEWPNKLFNLIMSMCLTNSIIRNSLIKDIGYIRLHNKIMIRYGIMQYKQTETSSVSADFQSNIKFGEYSNELLA